jgi:hypothetical protein
MRCNFCGEETLVPSKTRREGDAVLAWFGIAPYRCNRCCKRMTKVSLMKASGMVVLGFLLMCSLGGLLYYRNQVNATRFLLEMQVDPALQAGQIRVDMRKPVKNEDILALVRAGASRDVIYRVISRSPTQFHVDTPDLVELRKSSVPNDIISQMIEAMNSSDSGPAKPMHPLAMPAKAPVREFEATTH